MKRRLLRKYIQHLGHSSLDPGHQWDCERYEARLDITRIERIVYILRCICTKDTFVSEHRLAGQIHGCLTPSNKYSTNAKLVDHPDVGTVSSHVGSVNSS